MLLEPAISIVIPVYNEETNVEPLLQEITAVFFKETVPFEIIFVDDGSTDSTRARLQQLTTNNPTLKVVTHQKNYGQSIALCTGVRAASYPIVVTLDGDGQNDPNDIPYLLSFMKEKQTVVLGNRATRQDTLLRKISSFVGNWVRNALLKDNCPDTGCSLKIFPREAFMKLPQFNHMHRFLPILFQRAGYHTRNVSVNHRPRTQGVSKYKTMNRLWVGIYDLIGVCWLLRRSCFAELRHENP